MKDSLTTKAKTVLSTCAANKRQGSGRKPGRIEGSHREAVLAGRADDV